MRPDSKANGSVSNGGYTVSCIRSSPLAKALTPLYALVVMKL